MLIDKTQISGFAAFSDSIKASEIDIHIKNAEKFDLKPIVGEEMFSALNGERGAELESFFSEFIIPFLCLSAYVRFIPLHGRNITQHGITKIKGDTFEQLDGEERSEILKSVKSDLSAVRLELKKALYNAKSTFDGTEYETEGEKLSASAKSFGIRAPRIFGSESDPDLNLL